MVNDELSNTIKSLQEALKYSPDNLPLRRLYIDSLIKADQIDTAFIELKSMVINHPEDVNFKYLLSQIYYQRQEISKGIVLIEDLAKSTRATVDIVLLYVKLIIEEKNLNKAANIYHELKLQNPSVSDDFIETRLNEFLPSSQNNSSPKIDADGLLSDINAHIPIEKPRIKFEDVGGMAQVKDEIAFKIIRPLQNKELFAAYGKKAGGGILLYGPPGCGKTYIARATAGETKSSFMSVSINEVLNMYLGESEENLHSLFDFARRNVPTVLFFDEVDALGASRTDMKSSAGRYLINQFLMELDGDKYSNENMLILAATNTPWYMDSAFLRPGRFDRIIFVPPPDYDARVAIFKILIKDKPAQDIDFQELTKKTEGFSGADMKAVVDMAVEDLLREVLRSNIQKPLTMKELSKALKSAKPSTRDWFHTAKNYVVYSNESGLYDDVAKYLNIHK